MDQPIQDGIGHGGVVDHAVPLVDRELAGDERGALPVAVIEDLQQVAILFAGDGRHAEVIDHD